MRSNFNKRLISILTASVLLQFFIWTSAATAASLDWQAGFGDSNTYPYKSFTLPSGNSFLVGQVRQGTSGQLSDMKCFASSISDTGALISTVTFGREDALCATANVTNGGPGVLLVAALAQDATSITGEVWAIKTTFNPPIIKIINLPGEQIGGIASDSEGSIYISSSTGNSGDPVHIRKFSESLSGPFELTWQVEYPVYSNTSVYVYDLAISDAAGQVFVGTDQGGFSNSSVIGYRTSDGAKVWEQVTPGPVYAVSVDISSNSNSVLVAGAVLEPQEGYVMKLSTSGRALWQNTISSTQEDYASDVIADSTGQISVVGVTYGALTGISNGGIDSFIYTYNANGGLIDQTQFGSIDNESANSVGVDSIGRTYVFGWQNPASQVSNLPLKGVVKPQLSSTSNETNSFLSRFAKVNSKGKSAQPKKPPRR